MLTLSGFSNTVIVTGTSTASLPGICTVTVPFFGPVDCVSGAFPFQVNVVPSGKRVVSPEPSILSLASGVSPTNALPLCACGLAVMCRVTGTSSGSCPGIVITTVP